MFFSAVRNFFSFSELYIYKVSAPRSVCECMCTSFISTFRSLTDFHAHVFEMCLTSVRSDSGERTRLSNVGRQPAAAAAAAASAVNYQNDLSSHTYTHSLTRFDSNTSLKLVGLLLLQGTAFVSINI